MSEQAVAGPSAGAPAGEPDPEIPPVAGAVALALLVVDAVLVAVVGLALNPGYWNSVPVPLGALLTLLVVPWLVLQAAEVDPSPRRAGAPVAAWALTVAVLVLIAPGGDTLLPPSWQSLVLVVVGLGGGLVTWRSVVERAPAAR